MSDTKTEPKVNFELLTSVFLHINQLRDQWKQSQWRHDPEVKIKTSKGRRYREVTCNTSFCFAGWAIQMGSETPPLWYDDGVVYANKYDDSDHVWKHTDASTGTKHKVIEAEDRARRLLGLDDYEAERLFAGSNSLKDIEDIIEDIRRDNS